MNDIARIDNRYSSTWRINVRAVILASCLIVISAFPVLAQKAMDETPMIGAEIFIEPGQKPEQVDIWFKRLKESGMTITRIRMFETYMRRPDGSWDFTLFDHAYKAAEKYGIKVYANLFPQTDFADLGGLKYPQDEENLASISRYIEKVVTHFGKFSSLYGWVPINEPGIGEIRGEYSWGKFKEWAATEVEKTHDNSGYDHFDFAENRFLLEYNVWFLQWLTAEIRRYDKERLVHVNNHALFSNMAIYDFPQWRRFLTSLGGSAHASWHFGYFKRDHYAVAMSASAEIIRSSAGDLPWLMTEIQGGNNTYSGRIPICPTKEEIAQWLWAVIGAESKGAIFWCLNPRNSGIEAGEWALLNFQDEPTDRMLAAAEVAKAINDNSPLFANARLVESGVNVIYSREALWVEKKMQYPADTYYEGRETGGVMKSALAYFEALGEMGIQANLKEIGEFDFSGQNFTGTTIILSHQISIHSRYWRDLSAFVQKGGKLIVDGLTGYYDENAICLMTTGFPFENMLGGVIREFRMEENLFNVSLDDPKIILPAHLWRGTIAATTGKVIGCHNGETIAIRNAFGDGETVWLPSLAGLGARIAGDHGSLTSFLNHEIDESLRNVPFRFMKSQPGMFMRTLRSGDKFITILFNKSNENRKVDLLTDRKYSPLQILYADKGGTARANIITIAPEETMAILWE